MAGYKSKTELVVPSAVRRKAGIKAGDLLEFKVSPGTFTITASQPTYRPTTKDQVKTETALKAMAADPFSGDICQAGRRG